MSRAQDILEGELTQHTLDWLHKHGDSRAKEMAGHIKKLGASHKQDSLVGQASRHIRNKVVGNYSSGRSLHHGASDAKRDFVQQHAGAAKAKFAKGMAANKSRALGATGLAGVTVAAAVKRHHRNQRERD